MTISTLLSVGFLLLGIIIARRAALYGHAADDALSGGDPYLDADEREPVADRLNVSAIRRYQLAVGCYGVSIGLGLGHLLWPIL